MRLGARRAGAWRWLRATGRDTVILFREFRLPLLLFALAIVGGGLLFDALARRAAEPLAGPVEAIYTVLALTFLQSGGAFPRAWYLQTFYFVMPVVGIGILARGLADFGAMFFNRRARSKEWEAAVASTFGDHVVLVGLGHLGYRVTRKLHDMEQDVVVIEVSPEADLAAAVRALGIPVLQDDGTREAALRAAGVERARALLLCTQNDSLNLQIAVKARSLNPRIQVIVRIFDDDFAQALEQQFGFMALSTSGMAASAFAAAAAGVDVTRPITVDGQALSLARLEVASRSALAGRTVHDVEEEFRLSVVLLQKNGNAEVHPAGDRCLVAGETVAVLGSPKQIDRLVCRNR
ncbi:MAG: potassium channel family protein [Anaerolineae bacterium]